MTLSMVITLSCKDEKTKDEGRKDEKMKRRNRMMREMR